MRRGVRYGIDVGRARVGVARSDVDGLMAVPSETLERDSALDTLSELAGAVEIVEWVVGLPLSLDGTDTASTRDAREFGAALCARTAVPVRFVDERLTTVSAQSALRSANHDSKSQRRVIDQVAATLLLQCALDAERRGVMLGEVLEAG